MGKIFGNGMHQVDVVDLVNTIKTNWNAILTKLDNDTGVADTNYNALHAVTIPSGIDVAHPKGIRDQGVLLTFLKSVVTKFNAALQKLDLDATVADTNYFSTTKMTDPIANAPSGTLSNSGVYQGALVNLLDHILTKINALNAKLDADGGVNATNYASLHNITDNVDAAGTFA